MSAHEPFPRDELDGRLAQVRAAMVERKLDGLLIASPENIYYLTALITGGSLPLTFSSCHGMER